MSVLGSDVPSILEDCCDFPLKLTVNTTGLSSAACSGCVSGGSTTWDGVLRDYEGTRCIYTIDNFLHDRFDGSAGLNKIYTTLRRSQLRECVWLLFIACSHCAFNENIWVGSGPHFYPQGTYRVLYGCNMNVETVEVTETLLL